MCCICRPRTIFAFLAAMVVGVVLLGSMSGNTEPNPKPTPAAAEVMNWKLDPVHCMAVFRIQHMGAGMFWGKFDTVTGMVTYPEDDSEAPTFNVTVAVDSVDSGNEKLDKTLKGPQFFNAKEWDSITFVSTGAEKVSDKKWTVKGDLTLHGETRPVAADVEVTGMIGNPVQKKAGFEAVFSIKRSEFGMGWGVKNKALGDDVRLIVGLEGDWTR
jgi:polyisoprenoid-binding protein YceI